MKKLIGRFKRSNGPLLLAPTSASSSPVAGSSSTFAGVNASVHDNSQGHTFNIHGGNNTFSHGANMSEKTSKVSKECIEKLNRSYNAEYNMVINATRGPCTPKTRTIILDSLEKWRNSGKETIFWLNGMAGTGKTTIAYSASKRWSESHHLGASFFCSRGVPDCRDILLVLTTIAVELSGRYPAFGEALEESLSKDKDVQRRDLETQLKKLIIDPWNACKSDLPQDLVVVIDALDECEKDHSKLLRTLFDLATQLPFKVLITSRPEVSIRDIMLAKDSQTRSTFILHEVEKDMVKADIMIYLRSALPHASEETIETIADLADSFFIYAATVARLFETKRVNIQKCIQTLKSSLSTRDKSKMVSPLDDLYKEVLTRVLDDCLLEDSAQEIKDVLFTVVCAREPLTRRGLAGLCRVEEEEINRRLDLLRSVLFVSEQDNDLPITTFHASLPDFLLDESRSGDLYCNLQHFNTAILERCLRVMGEELRQNICHVDGRPSNDSLEHRVVESYISPVLHYAAIYWTNHWILSDSTKRLSVLNKVKMFMSVHGLHWFECLSWINRLFVSIQGLEDILNTLGKDEDVITTVYEYLRFIQQTYDPIEYSAMEVYSSALVWVPRHSIIRDHHATLFRNIPRTLCGLPLIWSGPERVISIHSDYVYSITISQDGSQLISGSHGQAVRVWNLRKQIEECVFTGHTLWVRSVALCKDQNLVVSGSSDSTIRVWDMVKRESILTITTSFSVWSVAISPDRKWIASGHDDKAVHIWDGMSGQLVRSLQGHEDLVRSLSFMANGTTLVSASNDSTARVWNVLTGQNESILRGHTGWVLSVACSLVEDIIVTGSLDRTARLWDTSGTELRVFKGHTGSVPCVDFMPDGKRAVTGSIDKTVRIWDVISGELVYVFSAPGSIGSIAVFMDGTKIAASLGREVVVWDIKGVVVKGRDDGKENGTFPVDGVERIVFSSDRSRMLLLPMLKILDRETFEEYGSQLPHDGKYKIGALTSSGRHVAASADDSHVISVWKLEEDGTVAEHFTLTGHTRWILSLSFSHNEHRLVSTSGDETARVWNVITRKQIHSLHHSKYVDHAVFSHDDHRIASTTSNITHLWDAQSGQRLHRWYFPAFYVAFTHDDHHLIIHHNHIYIFNTQTFEQEHECKIHRCWTTLQDGSSYTFKEDGWIYHFASFGARPRKVLWVPSPYRPTLEVPPFTLPSSEARIYLPRHNGLTVLQIPCDH